MDSKLISALKHCFTLPPEDAVKYMETQGFEISWDWKQQKKLISEHAFTVAKVTSADILQTFHEELTKSVKQGITYSDFKKNIKPMLAEKGWEKKPDGSAFRLDTIYRTNLQSAYMAGRYKEMKAVEKNFPYWQYIAIMDNRTRPSHAALNRKVVRSDDSFWDTNFTPRGYSCRCRTRALSESDIKSMGLKVSDGGDLMKYKPDEGFDNSPADVWKPDTTKYVDRVKKQLGALLMKDENLSYKDIPAEPFNEETFQKRIDNLIEDGGISYNEFLNKYEADRQDYESTLPAETVNNLNVYRGNGYSAINKAMRENDTSNPNYIKGKNIMDNDVNFKFEGIKQLLRGDHAGNISELDYLAEYKIGHEVGIDALFSTTIDMETAHSFASTSDRTSHSVFYVIDMPKEYRAGFGTPHEAEILLKAKTKLFVTDIERMKSDYRGLECEKLIYHLSYQ